MRNANDYFCGAVHSLQETIQQALIESHRKSGKTGTSNDRETNNNNKGNSHIRAEVTPLATSNSSTVYTEKRKNIASNDPNSYLIVAPQFLSDSDICWHPLTGQLMTVNSASDITCGFNVWTAEGWKDGS